MTYIWHICSRVERDISNAVIQSWKQKEYWNSYLWLQELKEKSEGAIKLSIILYCLLILIFLVLVKIGPNQDQNKTKAGSGWFSQSCWLLKCWERKSWKSRGYKEIGLHNLENREEKEKFFLSLENREEKEELFLHFLKIERRTRHEN